MTGTVLFSLFALLLLLRVPIAIALAGSTILIFMTTSSFAPEAITQRIFSSLDNTTIMAIVGFVFAGIVMARGGISKYLIESLRAWVGHLPGGLAIVTTGTCMIFAAISGSSPATAAAVGMIMIPAMVEAGYSKRFAMGLVAASGTLGILIPPSVPMMMFGVTAEESIGKLFTAGIVPGIFLGFVLMAAAVIYSKIHKYGLLPKADWQTRWRTTGKAIWGYLFPALILYIIYSGIATPTETAVISSVYAIIVSAFIYRELSWKDIRPILRETVSTSAMIYLIIAAAHVFGMYLTINQIPQAVANWVIENNLSVWMFFLLVNIMFFIMGAFLESLAIIVITLPILLPIIKELGINIYHFAIVMIVNMELAMITPPVGLNLFVVSGIAREKLGEAVRGVTQFIVLMIAALIVLVIFPQMTLVLIE